MDARFSKPGKGTGLLMVSLMALPILYVLSTGPAAWLINYGYLGESFFGRAYAPLIWLHDKWLSVLDPLDAYVELWEK